MRAGRAPALLALGLLGALPLGAAPADGAPATRSWNFRALLDGRPIGQHRFSVDTRGAERIVASDADFAVKILGLTAYRYRHQASEHWLGGCLATLRATTNDGGTASAVHAERGGGALRIDEPVPARAIAGCVMSFAYWNPAILAQTRLLNAQTGQLEDVQVERVGPGTVEVRGRPVAATAFRILGAALPIEIWYSAQDEWVGLDSVVTGGRRLSYRLQ
jgi:hypothetical protein